MFISFTFFFSLCIPRARCANNHFFLRCAQHNLKKSLKKQPKFFIFIRKRNINAQLAIPTQFPRTPTASAQQMLTYNCWTRPKKKGATDLSRDRSKASGAGN